MCSCAIVKACVVGDDSPQVALSDDYRVIQSFAQDQPDRALNVWILPWRTGCSSNFDHPKCHDFLPEYFAEYCVVVTKQVFGRIVYADSLKHLLCRLYHSGVFCCISVNNSTPIMAEDYQDKEHSERCRRYCEEVDREEIRRMVLQESSPCLRWWLPKSNHVLGHYASDTLITSFSSSPWVRGAPHNGLASHMRRIRPRIFEFIGGRPCFRLLRAQNRRNPSRCHRITVSGRTICSTSRH